MKQLFKKPSYYLISSAMDGNEKAIEKLLAFYDPYISKCCLRSLYDEYGNVYIVVDMELNLLRKVNNYFYLFYFLSQNIFACHK